MNVYKLHLKKSLAFLIVLLVGFVLVACGGETVDPTPEQYQVTFETNGGTTLSPLEVTEGSQLTLPTSPTREGYDFVGWFTNQGLTTPFNESSEIEADMTLYAKWEIKSFLVNFDSDEGTAVDQQNVEFGDFVLEPATPEKEGYNFLGWYQDSTLETPYDFSAPVSGALTIYAKWEAYSDEDLAMADVMSLVIPEIAEEDLTLPTRGENGTTFKWSSSAQHFISNTGKFLPAGFGTGGSYVLLTAEVTLGSFKDTIEFEVFVPEMPESVVTSSKTVDFINLSDEYFPEDGEIDLFFMNNQDIPYVDMGSFIYLIDGAITSIAKDPVTFTGDDGEEYQGIYYVEIDVTSDTVVTVRYVAEYYQDGDLVETATYEAIVDFEANTFFIESFSFFSALVASTSTDFGQGLYYGDTFRNPGDGVLMDFNQYRFDFVIHEEGGETLYLMPLILANQF